HQEARNDSYPGVFHFLTSVRWDQRQEFGTESTRGLNLSGNSLGNRCATLKMGNFSSKPPGTGLVCV
ncbi:MAG TPA: hypothetical protein PKE58_16995, partial [Acidobacteriota bacterium]|nr:hypothetical protein [Acidobacteriota bacterium]